MANLNKVLLIGRMVEDPKTVNFSNGGRVAKFRFAVNNRKKNQSTGQWEDDPVFIDVEAYNRQEGRKLADLCEQYLKKGHQVYLECSLKLDTWDDKDSGQKRSKIKLVLNDLQFLEPKADGGNAEGGGGGRMARGGSAPSRPARSNGPAAGYDEEEPGPMDPPPAHGGQEEDIPF